MSTETRKRISVECAINEVYPTFDPLFSISEGSTQAHNRIEVEGEVLAESLGRISKASPDRTPPYDVVSALLDVKYLFGSPTDLPEKNETLIVHRSTDPVFFGYMGVFATIPTAYINDIYPPNTTPIPAAIQASSFKVSWDDIEGLCGSHWQFQGAVVQVTTQLSLMGGASTKMFQYVISETKRVFDGTDWWVVFLGDTDLPMSDLTYWIANPSTKFAQFEIVIWDYAAGVTDFSAHKGNATVLLTSHPPIDETRISTLGLKTE